MLRITAADDAAKLAYEKQYSSNPFATAGKVAGQLGYAETAPIRAVMTPLSLGRMAFAPGASNGLSTAIVNSCTRLCCGGLTVRWYVVEFVCELILVRSESFDSQKAEQVSTQKE